MLKGKFAIDGGQPEFSSPLHVGQPNIGRRDILLSRINEMLDRRWFSNSGPLAKEFESKIAEHTQTKHVITVCNATVGLEIMVRAANLTGEVIVPAYTFIATAHALSWQKIQPVFADMDPLTHNISLASIEARITDKTSAILATHVWGRPCDIEGLERLAKKHSIKLMFDAAHAFGCTYRGKPIGGFGLAEVFSFHATKFLNSFEGGAICTNDKELADRIRLMINFGFAGYDNVLEIGTNGKMTEVCAAMGLTSLASIEDLINKNRENYDIYREEVSSLPGVKLIKYSETERNNYQYIVLEVNEIECRMQRDTLVELLHAENVLARKYFWPGCHNMPFYRNDLSSQIAPKTDLISSRVIVLPTGQNISESTIRKICGIIRKAVT